MFYVVSDFDSKLILNWNAHDVTDSKGCDTYKNNVTYTAHAVPNIVNTKLNWRQTMSKYRFINKRGKQKENRIVNTKDKFNKEKKQRIKMY